MKLKDKIMFLLICVFLIILPIIPTEFTLKNVPISDIFLVSILFIYFIYIIVFKDVRKKLKMEIKDFFSSRLTLAMFILLIVMCFSIAYAADKVTAVKESIRFLTYLALFFIIKYKFSSEELLSKLLKLYTLIVTIVSAIGIIGYFTGSLIDITYGEKRAIATFGNPNSFGAFLMLGIFPIMMLAIYEKNKKIKSLYIIETIIILLGVAVSGSRNAYIALLLGCLVLSLVYSWKLIFALVPLGGVALCIPYVSKRILDIFSNTQNQSRIRLWQIAFMMIKEHPILGIGNGNYESLYNLYVKKYPKYEYGNYQNFPVHNSYLKVESELGILGILSFLWMIICSLLNVKKFISAEKKGFHKAFYTGFLASMIVFYVMNSFDNLLFVPKLTTYFWVILAVMEGILYLRRNKI